MRKYDIAAYVWPSYTGDELRSRMFWPKGEGEWQTVRTAEAKFEGHTWPRKPLWGYVNEADPKVMEMEISEATKHGVNVFIYDWYWFDRRPFLENCLNDGFLKAKNCNDMQFYIMWANHDANHLWNKELSDTECGETVIWKGGIDREGFEEMAVRLVDKYFGYPNYYKIDGCPVFMIYDVNNLITGLGGIEKTREALAYFRKVTREAGFPDLHLQFTLWGEHVVDLSGFDAGLTGSSKDLLPLLGTDSISHYQFVHFVDIDRDYADILPDVAKEWARIERDYSMPYFPHVSLGWDNNPRFRRFRPGIIKNNTPEAVEVAFRMAKEYLDRHPELPPLVTVNAWNEWTESSYLLPDNVNGYGYLEAVKRVFLEE